MKEIAKKPQAPPRDLSKLIRLLYVEDEDVNWEVSALNLSSRYSLTRAKTAEETFSILKTEKFHAIMMDIQLANSALDGLAITRILKGKEPAVKIPPFAQGIQGHDTPIIVVTAYSARYPREEILSYGADELITKPINFTHLALSLSRCLTKHVAHSRAGAG
jgi:CheY-like chemotaxis protein